MCMSTAVRVFLCPAAARVGRGCCQDQARRVAGEAPPRAALLEEWQLIAFSCFLSQFPFAELVRDQVRRI